MDRAPPPTLAAVGVGQHLADRAHKDAAIPVGRFQDPLVKEYLRTGREIFRWGPRESNCGAGDSDPELWPYTTAEPHSPVGKSLRATFDGLLSGRLLVALMDEI